MTSQTLATGFVVLDLSPVSSSIASWDDSGNGVHRALDLQTTTVRRFVISTSPVASLAVAAVVLSLDGRMSLQKDGLDD